MKPFRAELLPAILVMACGSSSTPASRAEPAAQPSPEQKPTPESAPKEVPAPSMEGLEPLLVGSGSGLVEYDRDAKELRTLTDSAAVRPRILNDGSVLFLQPVEGHWDLMRIDAEGKEARVARIPAGFDAKSCKPAAADEESWLDVQEEYAFGLDEAQRVACITLADRNDNMADLRVMARIELETGKVQTALDLDNNGGCPEREEPICELRLGARYDPGTETQRDDWTYRWDDDAAQVLAEGQAALTLCRPGVPVNDEDARDEGCALAEGSSQSGRFELLRGSISHGDYIHRELFILDRHSGQLLGMMGEDHQLQVVDPKIVMQENSGSIDVVGESDVRWVGGDRLWIDGQLFDPAGKRVWSLGEYLAY